MSAEQPHKDNTGVLFVNSAKWKAQGVNRPDYGGECTIAGKRYRVAAWEKVSDAGQAYLSLAFSLPAGKESKP